MEITWLMVKKTYNGYIMVIQWLYNGYIMLNPPAPKVLGRDLPDGTRKRLQVYLGGGNFSAKTSCF